MNELHYQVLNDLSNNHFCSGEYLGGKYGVSRAAIWKVILAIRNLGITVHAVRGRGYCLDTKLELLHKDKILKHLTTATAGQINELHTFKSIASTNTFLLDLAKQQNISNAVCLAETQTNGRGRRGKNWLSPFGHNIYLSMLFSFDSAAVDFSGLSLVVGLALKNALVDLVPNGLTLKWPNDLYYEDKKLAGILIEITGDINGKCSLVIGIGVNVYLEREAKQSLVRAVTDLAAITSSKIQRNKLAARIIENVTTIFPIYYQTGFSAFQQDWLSVDFLAGKQIELDNHGKKISGLCLGVNHKGHLQMQIAGEIMEFASGEVSVQNISAYVE